jgi:amino acid adenylation domain-containing protein
VTGPADSRGAEEGAGFDRLSPAKRELAERRLLGRVPGQSQLSPVSRRVGERPARLSFAQEQLWYFSRLAPENPVYNESITIRKDGPFSHRAFVRAFNEIVRRHEAWRTTFVLLDGEPVQRVGDPPTIDLPVHDLSGRSLAEAEHEAALLAAADALVPYDLATGPLIRPRLVRFSDEHHRLYLALHHLVFDGVSLNQIVLPELVTLYDAFSAGSDSPLPEPVVRYGDYAEWERQWMAGPVATARLDYWRRRLADVPTLELPLDSSRPLTQRFHGWVESFSVSTETAEALRLLATSLRVTLFQVLAACYAVLLHRYSGQDEVVFGSPVDLRQRPELQTVVGMCLTPLVLRCSLAGDPSFIDLVRQLSSEVIEALSNAVPFAEVVRAVRPDRDLRTNPLFQALLSIQPLAISPDPSWSVHQMDSEVGNAIGNVKFDLSLELDERPDGHLDGLLFLDADLFEPATGPRMVGHVLTLLESVAEDPERPVSALRLLTEHELHRQLFEWNATEVDPPSAATVPELVAQQAQRSPNAVALEFEGLCISYAELEAAANWVAARLRAAGVVRGDVVALHCNRGLEVPIGMLAIMKAGGAYLPLDPKFPSARLAFMVHDAGAMVMLCEPALFDAVPELGIGEVVVVPLDVSDIGDPWPEPGEPDLPATATDATDVASGDDLAYVLYTSGSSGMPKGVQVPHSGVVNMLSSLACEPGMTADDTVLAVASFGFDAATSDLWLPLAVGARVVIAPADAVADGSRLVEIIERAGVTSLTATSTTWQLLVEAGWSGTHDLVAVAAGEPLSAGLAEDISSRCAQLWNVYGPTEATVTTTLDRVEHGDRITIGRPIANAKVYVLDLFRQPVPVGVAGELYIAGAGVARGYVNRPDETAARFSDDPFNPGGRMYRTGDRVRQLPDGRLQHLGRLDDQVKLRGYRIELGEVESALRLHPSVASAVVLIDEPSPAGARLIAYVVPRSSMPLHRDLRLHLRESLPEYMVPSVFVELEELPRTPNGKLDRGRLPLPPARTSPLPATGAASLDGTALTPREAQLIDIWREILDIENVGLDDDFFDLGGHSVLALRLVAAAGSRVGVEVPLSFLYERGATVREMVLAIEEAERWGESTSAARHGRSRSSVPILFFIVANEVGLAALRHLRPVLAPEHAVVGFASSRLGQRMDRAADIEERAASILKSIVRIQDQGPYFLAGSSFGGLIVYEIATLLREDGQEVAWLGLVNTSTPAAAAKPSKAPVKAARAVIRPRATTAALGRHLRSLGSVRPGRADDITRFNIETRMQVGLRYVPRPNGIALDLFVSDRDAITLGGSLGWHRSHAAVLRIHTVPGTHRVLLDPHEAPALARAIRRSLDSIR